MGSTQPSWLVYGLLALSALAASGPGKAYAAISLEYPAWSLYLQEGSTEKIA